MIRAAYSFLLIFLLLFLELLLENTGIRMMLIAPAIFYLAVAFGIRYGILWSILAGCALDFCSGADNPWSVLCFLLVTAFAALWLHHSEGRTMFQLMIPGTVLPFLAQFPSAVIQSGFRKEEIMDSFLNSLFSSCLMAFLFPLMVVILDWIGSYLSLELFADAGERIRNSKNTIPHHRIF